MQFSAGACFLSFSSCSRAQTILRWREFDGDLFDKACFYFAGIELRDTVGNIPLPGNDPGVCLGNGFVEIDCACFYMFKNIGSAFCLFDPCSEYFAVSI